MRTPMVVALTVAAALAGAAGFASALTGLGGGPAQGPGAVAAVTAAGPAAAPPAASAVWEQAHRRTTVPDILGYSVVAVTHVPVPTLAWELRRRFSRDPGQVVEAGTYLFYHLRVRSTREMRDLLARLPAAPGQLAHCSVASLPADFDEVPLPDRKRLFVEAVAPVIEFDNGIILAQRQRLERLAAPTGSASDGAFLQGLCASYRLRAPAGRRWTQQDTVAALLERVDLIPASLALTQAALESGWGTSLLTRSANNLFGQRALLLPAPGTSSEGATQAQYGVFPTLASSVGSYMLNLNSHGAYAEFRRLRAALRRRHRPLDPQVLAGGLHLYSERGSHYVDDVRSLMRESGLRSYDVAPGGSLAASL